MTGETGSGKTSLTRALLDELAGTGVRVGWLPYPDLDPHEFHTVLAEVFPGYPDTGDDVVEKFRRFLGDVVADGQRVLLVVDEAQALRPELFREFVRLIDAISHVDGDRMRVFNVLLVGQTHLDTILCEPEHAAFAERLRVRLSLRPFGVDEVAEYARHHLDAATFDVGEFTPEAIDAIRTRSGGIPRMIHVLCDQSLRAASAAGVKTVDAAVVAGCVGDEISEVGSESRAILREEHIRPEHIDEVVEITPRRPWVLRGGVVLLGLTISAGVVVYLTQRSPSLDVAPRAVTTEQGTPRADASRASELPVPSPAITSGETAVETTASAPTSQAIESVTAEPPLNAPRAGARPGTVGSTRLPGARETAVTAPSRPATPTEEPDPQAVIDWLFKQSPRQSE